MTSAILFLSLLNDKIIIPAKTRNYEIWGKEISVNRSFNLCILFIPEIYTLQGNSYGFPCVFPFKYNNKWYYECTRDGKEFDWCATTTHYEQDEKWGFCPNTGKKLLVFSFPHLPKGSLLFFSNSRTHSVLDYSPSFREQYLFKNTKEDFIVKILL